MTTIRRRLAFLIAFGLAAASSACGGDGLVLPSESRPASITIVSGDEQSAAAGATLGAPLVVRVSDALDRPVEGQVVAFTVDAGGGSVAPGNATTNSDGIASSRWTLGASAGSQQVEARVQADGLPAPLLVDFTASAVSGSGAVLEFVSGDDQTAPVLSALPDSLVVRVTDALGNPVAGMDVQWSAEGGGSISPATVTTGADGLAAAERVLGGTAGTQTSRASASGLTPVGFTHTAVAANPTVLRRVSGDGQTGSVGSPLADPLVVRLEDENGNGVGGKAVTFVVGPDAGSADPVNATTDPNGFASTVWTLGPNIGSQTLNAIFSGLSPVAFTATAGASTPTRLAFTQPPQTTAAGVSFSPALQVTVQDAGGNTVTAATNAITLAIGTNPSGGTLAGTLTVSAVNGVATFPGVSIDKVGTGYTLTAEAAGLTGATSPAFDIVATQVATSLTVVQDTPDPSIIGQPVTVTWNLSSTGTEPITGNVTVTVNGTSDSCSAPAALGSGSCDVVISLNGSRRLTARFPGDANYATASDNEAHQVKGTTSTTVASSTNPSTVGQSVTLTAHVSTTGGSTGSPGGQVKFFDGGNEIGTASLNSTGDATITTSFLVPSDREITAVYQGSTTFEPSTSAPLVQQVDALPNQAPTADDDAGPSYTVLEDGSLNALASVLQNDDDPDNSPSSLIARNASDPANGAVTLDSDGTFTYTPDPDFNGSDSFTYEAYDGEAGATATVTITVTAVNDAPSFTKGADQSAPANDAPQLVQNWAPNFSAGPANESTQEVDFVVSMTSADSLQFLAAPQVDGSGALTYTLSASATGGPFIVNLYAHDNGGMSNGGQDSSLNQTFTISIATGP